MSIEEDHSFVTERLGELKLPRADARFVTYRQREADAALIFVHGIFSDNRSCWYKEDASSYWPDLVARDERFNDFSIFLGGYYTALDAGTFKVQDCANELFMSLVRPDLPGTKAPLARSRLIFVCHSTGGIVVRYLLDSRVDVFRDKEIGLLLIASPSYGSHMASKLSWLSKFYHAKLSRQLEWGNDTLTDLDDRFHLLIKQKRIPRLVGTEAYENHFIVHGRLVPDRLQVVSKESAGRYFSPPIQLPNTDHFSCVKPDSQYHPAHKLLLHFLYEFEQAEAQWHQINQVDDVETFPVSLDLRVEYARVTSPPSLPSRGVSTQVSRPSFLVGEAIRIFARPGADCYLTIVNFGMDNVAAILFPNQVEGARRSPAGGWLVCPPPDGSYNFPLNGPVGIESLVCLASSEPLTLRANAIELDQFQLPRSEIARLLGLNSGKKLLGLKKTVFEVLPANGA